jgi:hypothetical protein
MNKHQKYINFIVDDLVKGTEIIQLPKKRYNMTHDVKPPFHIPDYISYTSFLPRSYPDTFPTYLQQRYGVREEEVGKIWNTYRKKIYTILNNG